MVLSRLVGGTIALGLAASAIPCHAETVRSFALSAVVANGCAVTNAAGSWGKIDFGSVAGLKTATVDADLVSAGGTGLKIECTPGTSINLTADNGNNASSGQRRLAQTGVSTAVPYALYANGSGTPWTTQSIPLAFPAGNTTQLLPIKGRASLPGSLQAGPYTDTVRITLAW